jgi:hypothetical protein
MDYSILPVYGRGIDLYSSHGNGELDRLDEHMLRDVGYKRIEDRIVKDEDPPGEPAAEHHAWSWLALWRIRLAPRRAQRSARSI